MTSEELLNIARHLAGPHHIPGAERLWVEAGRDWHAWSAWWGQVAQLVTEARQ